MFRQLTSRIMPAASAVLLATLAHAQQPKIDMAALERWGDVKVVRYHIEGVYSGWTNIANPKGEAQGDITELDDQFDILTRQSGSLSSCIDDVLSLVRDIEARAEAREAEAMGLVTEVVSPAEIPSRKAFTRVSNGSIAGSGFGCWHRPGAAPSWWACLTISATWL